jgi:hypothetical protein
MFTLHSNTKYSEYTLMTEKQFLIIVEILLKKIENLETEIEELLK